MSLVSDLYITSLTVGPNLFSRKSWDRIILAGVLTTHPPWLKWARFGSQGLYAAKIDDKKTCSPVSKPYSTETVTTNRMKTCQPANTKAPLQNPLPFWARKSRLWSFCRFVGASLSECQAGGAWIQTKIAGVKRLRFEEPAPPSYGGEMQASYAHVLCPHLPTGRRPSARAGAVLRVHQRWPLERVAGERRDQRGTTLLWGMLLHASMRHPKSFLCLRVAGV